MTENRDFLSEIQQLRAETDGIRNVLVSNPGLSNHSVLQSGILDEIVRELKNVRSEIKEMKTENEKKLEEMKIEMKKEIIEQKLELLEGNRQLRVEIKETKAENKKKFDELLQKNQQLGQRMTENEKKNGEKLSELQKRILDEVAKMLPVIQPIDLKNAEEMAKSLGMQLKKFEEGFEKLVQENQQIRAENRQLRQKIEKSKNTDRNSLLKRTAKQQKPIREAILGEWKLVKHENFEAARESGWSFETFSANMKYELEQGKLIEMGGVVGVIREKGYVLYVDGQHLKTFRHVSWNIDRYIQDGRLHVNETHYGRVWKRIYQKI